ncbi:putative hemoglobin receptor component HpuA domain protein, partial [Neisseria meningitidis 69155]
GGGGGSRTARPRVHPHRHAAAQRRGNVIKR